MGWLLPGAFGCSALPTSFPMYIIPNGAQANGIKLPLIAAHSISAIYYIVISPSGCLALPFSIPVSHLIRYQIPHRRPARSLQINLGGVSCSQNRQSQNVTTEPKGWESSCWFQGLLRAEGRQADSLLKPYWQPPISAPDVWSPDFPLCPWPGYSFGRGTGST